LSSGLYECLVGNNYFEKLMDIGYERCLCFGGICGIVILTQCAREGDPVERFSYTKKIGLQILFGNRVIPEYHPFKFGWTFRETNNRMRIFFKPHWEITKYII